MTSATEKLRKMLDERCVEYREADASYTFLTYWTDSLGRGCSFSEEVYDGESHTMFVSAPAAHDITPEQAIAATLGEEIVRCGACRRAVERPICKTFANHLDIDGFCAWGEKRASSDD